ncbi:MAG TPA: DUF4956 domain-containing protein [Pyrinomonadaceae bacterium]
MNKATVRLLLIFLVVLIGSALLVYLALDRMGRPGPQVDRPAVSEQADAPIRATPTPDSAAQDNPFLAQVLQGAESPRGTDPLETGSWPVVISRIFLRFLVGAVLAAILAFRWRRGRTNTMRNPYVAQTQILLAVVAAAMMMVVGDSAARAFGIFAAASLVRFRTNIRDPKETTVLLICLGVGLACGVGRMDMAGVLTVFALLTLWLLEHFESGQVFRTMELKVGTQNIDQTHQVLRDLFERHGFTSELRHLQRATESDPAQIVYQVIIGSTESTNELAEEVLTTDGTNITSLEWDQKKSTTYIYR